jgi:hypothetical protein
MYATVCDGLVTGDEYPCGRKALQIKVAMLEGTKK